MNITLENYKRYFDSRVYSGLNMDQRRALLDFTVKQEAERRGISNVDLAYKGQKEGWTPGNRGSMSCSFENGQLKQHVTINQDVLTRTDPDISYSSYKTICHELEHGVQNEQMYDPKISNDNMFGSEEHTSELQSLY